MRSQNVALVGAQAPRLRLVPDAATFEAGREAIDLVETCGLYLDEGQQLVICDGFGERVDGSWAASEKGVIESRQNGKGSIIETEIIEGLFLSKLPLQLYTAHLFPTALEMFRRVQALLVAGSLMSEVKRISNSHGDEGIELHDGCRVLFKTRTANIARGMTVHRLYVDEAYNYGAEHAAALQPTLSAAPNPQVGYYSSAGDRDLADCSELARLRRRAVKAIETVDRGDENPEPRLAFSEWSVPYDDLTGKLLVDPGDPRSWAMANPAMNVRIAQETIETEHRSMSPKAFARERLGVGYWPRDEDGESMIAEFVWNLGADPDSSITDRLMFGVAVAQDLSSASISAAGFYAHLEGASPGDVDALDVSKVWHTEVIVPSRAGTKWVAPELARMVKANGGAVIIDPRSPAGSLIPEFEEMGVPFEVVNASSLVTACAMFYRLATHQAVTVGADGVETAEFEPLLRHPDQPSLAHAVNAAIGKPLAGGWKFIPMPGSGADLTPLDSAVLALHGAMVHAEDDYDPLDSIE